jgi:type 1 glutamine amidotransferase
MGKTTASAPLVSAAAAALVIACAFGSVLAQQAPPAGGAQASGGGRGGRGAGAAVFTATDANKDGAITRDEFKSAFDGWFTAWDAAKAGSLTQAQLAAGLAAAMPAPVSAGPPPEACGGRSANPQVACPADVDKMLAALPDSAPAKPLKPRKILVLGHAAGFVHSSIPLAAKFVEAAGTKTKAWTTTITYNAADINKENLKQYDLVFLDSTTGCFLDDPSDKAATDARRAALLEFVRGGKGIAGIHASTDSYHGTSCGGGAGFGAPGGGAPGGGGAGGPGAALAAPMIAQGDKNADQRLSRDELNALTDAWFDKLDPEKTGRVAQADFGARFASLTPAPARGTGADPGAAAGASPGGQPLWPEFNRINGGYFKFHWVDPQLITVKIDDPRSPLTAMFHGQEFEIRDETYTFNEASFSRSNVHVLTSIDYDKMSPEDKAKEPTPRTDHDYGLSWIRREGSGRIFYEAHGHSERVYAMRPMLEHVIAGIQYALGDLKADDSPSVKTSVKK